MTLWEKPFKNMGNGENAGQQHFSFSHYDFYPIKEEIVISLTFVVSKCFQFETGLNFIFW